MNKDNVTNLAASVHQKLLNKARQTGRPFNELMQYHAIERFLYRLSVSRFGEQFVLKGALMFNAWGLKGFRSTRDIDLLGHTSNVVEKILVAFREICAADVPPDGWVFDVESVQGERIKEDADYEGVRVTFTGWLGRTRASMQIDIGFGDVVVPAPVPVKYPVILDFPIPALYGYPRETLIAEKFQAMVALGEINSRMKDFYDIFHLAITFDFDGHALQQAIEQTFRHRQTSLPTDVPVAFTQNFIGQKSSLWTAFLRRLNLAQADNFDRVVSVVEQFLMPPVQASIGGQVFEMLWVRGQGWVGDRQAPI